MFINKRIFLYIAKLVKIKYTEASIFKTAIDNLKQSNLQEKADTLARVEIKLRNLLKPEQKNKIEIDADELMKAEGLVFIHLGRRRKDY